MRFRLSSGHRYSGTTFRPLLLRPSAGEPRSAEPSFGADTRPKVEPHERRTVDMRRHMRLRRVGVSTATVCLLSILLGACGGGNPHAPKVVDGSLGTREVVAQFKPSAPKQLVDSFETSGAGQALFIHDGASGFDLDPANRTLTVYFSEASSQSDRQAVQKALDRTGLFGSVTVLP